MDEIVRLSVQRREEIDQQMINDEIPEEIPSKKTFSVEEFINCHGARILPHIIGFDLDEFNTLFRFLKDCLIQIGRGRRGLDAKEKLFIFFSWISTGMSFTKLSALFKVSSSTIHENINYVIKRIKGKLISKFLPTSGEEARKIVPSNFFSSFPEAIGAVDTTILKISRPFDIIKQKKYFSGKHKVHCVKFQIVANPDGWCLHYYGHFPGKKHDIKIFEESEINNFLQFQKETRNGIRINVHPQILADSGYQGAQKNYEEIRFPFKKPPNGDITNEEKEFNQKLSRDRIIVENFFGRMKMVFGLMHGVYKGELLLLNDLIPIIVCLTNFHISRRPLRRSNVEIHNSDDSSSDFSPSDEEFGNNNGEFNMEIVLSDQPD